MGIILHEKGELQQSAYYLRKAAQGGNMSGMILYGLALRHGWGLKVNKKQAVEWLHRAVERAVINNSQWIIDWSVGLDKKQSESLRDSLKPETRSQLGLALYELGTSYMKPWGVDKDENMAMRCFKVGSVLGDADAMFEEASLLCRNGQSWKKDLFRAAELYRAAADKGVSAIGNNWIYKEKYMPKGESRVNRDSEKGARTRSRSLFSYGRR
ncbi:hypothetical protein V1511DRAFT_462756 [Dipodascopsis uninucleata]